MQLFAELRTRAHVGGQAERQSQQSSRSSPQKKEPSQDKRKRSSVDNGRDKERDQASNKHQVTRPNVQHPQATASSYSRQVARQFHWGESDVEL